MRLLTGTSPTAMRALLDQAVAGQPTYAETGASDAARLPPGYRAGDRSVVIGSGRAVLDRVGAALMRWDVHRGAGMAVLATHATATPSATVVGAAPYGPVWVPVPCRVVAVIEEDDRRGFVYGTLPGNPVRGEERFTVELAADGRVAFRLRSFSRASGLPALFPPAARGGQWLANRRYHAAAQRLGRVASRRGGRSTGS